MDALQAYRESSATDDDPVHLIVLLHDQLLRDLRRALDAFEKQNIHRRVDEVDHALVVLGQLQGTLNLESGGEVAANLDRFYNLMRDNLLHSVLEGSPELLQRHVEHILGLREAWLEVGRQQSRLVAGAGVHNVSQLAESDSDDSLPQGSAAWKA